MKNNGTVYGIENQESGRMYIGSTTHLKERIYAHMIQLEGGKHPVEDMQKDYAEHNILRLYVMWQGEADAQTLHKIEQLYMDVYHTRDRKYGYNYGDPSKSEIGTTKPSTVLKAENVNQAVKSVLEEANKYFKRFDKKEIPQSALENLHPDEVSIIESLAQMPADMQNNMLWVMQGMALAMDMKTINQDTNEECQEES